VILQKGLVCDLSGAEHVRDHAGVDVVHVPHGGCLTARCISVSSTEAEAETETETEKETETDTILVPISCTYLMEAASVLLACRDRQREKIDRQADRQTEG
jgi:hypothetical protein